MRLMLNDGLIATLDYLADTAERSAPIRIAGYDTWTIDAIGFTSVQVWGPRGDYVDFRRDTGMAYTGEWYPAAIDFPRLETGGK